MGAVLRFIGWVLSQGRRYGAGTVRKVADWARKNWGTVQKWIDRGVSWGTIVQWILQALGLA